ncbi:MAG: hypothetical protein ABGZ35_22595 [Planctomycetaceae bacterium]|jgi:hypothetical protein
MNPTIETWNVNPLDTGPIYPLVGWEMEMFIGCAAFCLGFMVWKFRTESAKYAAQTVDLQKSNELHRLLDIERR